MNITAKAYTAITLQSLITGFSFLALKIALRSADTMDLLAHRFTLAALSVLIFTLFRRGSLTIHLRDFLRILPYGIIYPIIFFLFQTLGMTQISSSEAGIIYAVVPIFTLIIAGLLLKERIQKIQAVFMLLSHRRRHLHPSDERISALRVQLYRFWADHRLRRLPGAV